MPPFGPGDRAADQQQVALGVDLEDLEAALGDPLAAHPARHLHALEHAGGIGAGADRARRADVVRAVGDRAAVEVVALDRALEALADRGRGDLHLLAGLELLDRELLADLRLGGLVAELDQDPRGRRAGLLQVAERGLAQLRSVGRDRRDLDGRVAVAVGDRGPR